MMSSGLPATLGEFSPQAERSPGNPLDTDQSNAVDLGQSTAAMRLN